MFRYLYIFILSFFFVPISAFCWERKICNYERNAYQAGFQNWNIDQSEKGWMYFANSTGLLEFDGVNWTLYPVKNKLVRSVKVIGDRIYVGGSSEFGYFQLNDTGILAYHSILSQSESWAGEVWNIFPVSDKVYFLDDYNIFIYEKDGSTKTIQSPAKIDCSALINGTIYLGSSDGIFYQKGQQSIQALEAASILRNTKIVSFIPYNDQILVVTARSGIYSIEGNQCRKVNFVTDSFVAQNQLFSASVMDDKMALGSVQNGIFLFDLKNMGAPEHFNLDNGLKNNTILSCHFDRDKNLWLGLDKGISYIDLRSSVQPLFAKDSPIGTGYCSAIYKGELYFGTNQGLYKEDKHGKYQLVKESEGQVWSLTQYDDLLFCAGDNHILVISPTQSYKINLRGVWGINKLSADKNKLMAGMYSGLSILEKKNNRWQFSHTIPNSYSYPGRGFIEDDVFSLEE